MAMTAKKPTKKPAAKKAAGVTTTKNAPANAGAKAKATPVTKNESDEATYRAPSWYSWNGVKLAMPNSPLTPNEDKEEGIPRMVTDEDYRERALSQMRGFLELADRVERMDETLKSYECVWIAGAVRAYASQIYLKPNRKGAAPKIDPIGAVMGYIKLRRDEKLKKTPAIDRLAEDLGVTDRAIKDVLAKYKDQVELLEETFYLRKLRKD